MKKILFWGQRFVALVIALSALAFVLPTSLYALDLLQSFAVHALVGYALLLGLFILVRAKQLAIVAGGAVAGLLLCLHSYILPPSLSHFADGQPFTVAHFNVLANNRQYDPVIRQALASKADLLSFQEVAPHWADELTQRLRDAYPYYHVVTDPWDTRGIAIFSRYPLRNVQTHYWSKSPNITGDIELSGRVAQDQKKGENSGGDTLVHFVASHTLSPRSESRYRRRNQQIRHIADYLKSVEGPVLAIGDYNAVPWNPSIVAMKQQGQVFDSRQNFTSTYPARLQGGGLPIDYVFHSEDFTCLDFYAVSAEGSDHRGVVGRYRLRPSVL
ncbi:MAG: endonuclease/exonuclease/phosphatase family protein [Tunicatimonas sp.]